MTSRFLAFVLIAALGLAGCAHPFTARRLDASPAATASARAGSVAMDVATLARTPAADGEARRAATARLVAHYSSALLAAPGNTIRLPPAEAGGRVVRLVLRRGMGPGGIEPARFIDLAPADDYRVTGVPGYARTPGVGVPLVGALQPVRPVTHPGPVEASTVSGLVWAVTAVPTFAGQEKGGARTLFLDLYDPHTTGQIPAAAGRRAEPLAADYTTPMAVNNTHFRPQNRGLLGVLRADKYFADSGIYATELPTPDKTPLIFVHGLISDPSDFHAVINALAADAEVRRRYQIWVFYYPTSLPVVYSAMQLRGDVTRFIYQLDPAGVHPALHRAVLVGHSMGGLLCRFVVAEGGDRFYRHFFRQPVDWLDLTKSERVLVQRAFYYRSNPDVAQVVFISTPHRGSGLASGFPGNLARLVVRMPVAVLGRIRPVITKNRGALVSGAPLKPGTSLDSLSPGDPVIQAVNDLPIRPSVRLHSIIGDRGRGGPPERSSDGVVPYASSHLPQAESERIVPAGHTGALARQETADELIRILTTGRTAPGR